ncbi:hypothetical protein F7R25_03755 [Burkholderia stagnalis]|uniref:Uncharacterized protein n=1 Tax=Burkholderia stagnalis TaxID=1503054 RepID=A0A6L3N3P3_9BURK|nr:hypothetical protein [Burkholderia stagnalis]KAB0640619.1 hypothetical protein F7R25_03755 [Burkholderia stagnalis]VWB05577.1 hypothetical protein BST28156_00071 [Burkholderia stagnalis]
MKRIALSLLLAGLSVSTFAATKDDIIKSIDSCNQITTQYLPNGKYDPTAIDQLYTVFNLDEQKEDAKDTIKRANEDKDPVELYKAPNGSCTLKITTHEGSLVKPIVEQKQ